MTIYKGIDDSVPIFGTPTTESVRDNFTAIIAELQALDAGGGGGANFLQELNDVVDPLAPTLDDEILAYNSTSGLWENRNTKLKNTTDAFSGIMAFDSATGDSVGALGITAADNFMGIWGDTAVAVVGPGLVIEAAIGFEGAFMTIGANGLVTYTQPADAGMSWEDSNAGPVIALKDTPVDGGVTVTPTVEVNDGNTEWYSDFTADNKNVLLTIRVMVSAVEYTSQTYAIAANQTSGTYGSIPNTPAFMTGTEPVTLEFTATESGVIEDVLLRVSEANQGGGGGGVWGTITGDILLQTDLQASLNTKLTDITAESIGDLSDVTITAPATNDALTWSGTAWTNSVLGFLTDITGESIKDLSDVDSTMVPLLDQVLTFNTVSGEWEAKDPAATGSTTLDGLTDTEIITVQDDDILKWSSVASRWQNVSFATAGIPQALDDLTDVSLVSVTDNEIFIFNASGGVWRNETFSEAGIPQTSGDLTDVSLTSLQDNQILVWSSAGGEWRNENNLAGGSFGLADLSDVDDAIAPTDGQILTWVNANLQWEASSAASTASKLDHTGGVATDIGETVHDFGGPVSVSATLDTANGQIQAMQIVGDTTVTITTTHTGVGFTLIVTNNASHTITWPASVRWEGGTAPDQSGDNNVFSFITSNGGTNWYGSALLDLS